MWEIKADLRAISHKLTRVRGRLLSRRVQYVLDLAVLACGFWLAYLLRFDFVLPPVEVSHLFTQTPLVVLIQFAALYYSGIYAFIYRYVSVWEIKAFITPALYSILPVLVLRLGLPETYQPFRVPLSIAIVDTVLGFGGVIGLRVLRRLLYERAVRRPGPYLSGPRRRLPILLIGAGQGGVLAAREIKSQPHSNIEIKGFIDDDREKQHAIIQGVKVLGTSNDIPRLVREFEIDHVIITIARATRQEIRRIVEICELAQVKTRIIPSFLELIEGRFEVSKIRDVQIEDLLGRRQVQLEEQAIERFILGKVVMVTGAGGSIGAELARQIARFSPAHLLLVERAEFALFEIERKLRQAHPELKISPLVADICDAARMQAVFAAHAPQVVLHAAAHKHVPMMESNPSEAIKNNVFGTRLVGSLAGEFGAEVFVLISTDKAVRPTSIMGASKRVAELVIQDLNSRYATRFVAVRFGNVLGSAGSVIQIFREQIAGGGPVTVTHPDMVRYFMTIPEASQLVLQAGEMGQGGEIFILDMGEPVRILSLAQDMIVLSGLKPYEEIDIVFTGIRPGEKLFEELDTAGEKVAVTHHPKIFIGKISPYSSGVMSAALRRLELLSRDERDEELRSFLEELLPEARLSERDPSGGASPISSALPPGSVELHI